MSGLCGWLATDSGDPAGTIEAMRAALLRTARLPTRRAQHAEAGLCLEAGTADGDFHADDRIMAAIEGYPRWTDGALAALARDRGHAAALAEAYRRKQAALFDHLEGAFALAVIDRVERKALLAIDRIGIRPLCYALPDAGGVVFGTTTDAVKAHTALGATVTAQTVFNYFYFYACPAPGTIYREQQKLLPAQYLIYENGRARTAFYWRMPYRDSRAAPADLRAQLMARLREGFAHSALGVDLGRSGAFLSGGLDSTTVTALLAEATHGRARTFTIGFPVEGYDETAYARAAVRHFGTEHHEYAVTPADVVDIAPRIAEVYDEPFGNSSAVPAYYCARLAREQGVDVLFAGDGGDEIFAGNKRYVEEKVYESYFHLPAPLRARVVEPAVGLLPRSERIALARKARNYVRRATVPMPDRLYPAGGVDGAPLAAMFTPEAAADIDAELPLDLARDAYNRADLDSFLRRMMHLDMQMTLADNDLRKVGRMCELAGVQVRYPMLDDTLVDFAAGIPPEVMMPGFRLRGFYRGAMRGFLPPEILAKKKHGFGMPLTHWLKTAPDLNALCRDSVAAFGRRGWLAPAFIDRLVGSLQPAGSDHAAALAWDAMMLELWLGEHA